MILKLEIFPKFLNRIPDPWGYSCQKDTYSKPIDRIEWSKTRGAYGLETLMKWYRCILTFCLFDQLSCWWKMRPPLSWPALPSLKCLMNGKPKVFVITVGCRDYPHRGVRLQYFGLLCCLFCRLKLLGTGTVHLFPLHLGPVLDRKCPYGYKRIKVRTLLCRYRYLNIEVGFGTSPKSFIPDPATSYQHPQGLKSSQKAVVLSIDGFFMFSAKIQKRKNITYWKAFIILIGIGSGPKFRVLIRVAPDI
jgi:hypothetical protein